MDNMSDYEIKNGALVKYLGAGGDIVIPNSVGGLTNLGIFNSCSSITSITIPSSVRSIWSGVLSDCPGLQNVLVDPGNEYFCSLDGVLFNKDMTEILCFPTGRTGDYVIPQGVTKVGWGAFYKCIGMTSVVFPDTVKEIGGSAFFGCSSIRKLDLPQSVETIDQGAFSGCDSLITVMIPASVKKLGEYGNDAVNGKNLKCINVDPGNKKYTSIDGLLFSGNGKNLQFCPAAKEGTISLPESLVGINSDAFCNCSKITKIVLPDKLNKIGSGAFYGCKGLKDISIPDGIQILADNTFEDCWSLENVRLGVRTAKIGREVFKGCSELKRISLPRTVVSIAKDAFPETVVLICYPETFSKLSTAAKTRTAIEFLKDQAGFDGDQASSVKEYIHSSSGKLLKVIIEEESVEALMGYAALVPMTEKDISAAIRVSTKSKKPQITAELLEMKNKRSYEEVNTSANKTGKETRKASGVNGSKTDWKKPKNGTTAIGRYLGTGSDVVFPIEYDGIQIDAIADTTKNAPENYKTIKTVTIPEGYIIIGKNAFAGCERLEKIQLPDTLKSIGAGAFTDCKALKEIVFPDDVSSFGSAMFSGCDLNYVELPSGLEFLPKNCFEGATVDSIVFRGTTLTGNGKVFDLFCEPKAIYTDAKVKIYGITKRVIKPLEDLAYRGIVRAKTPAEIKKEWVVSELSDGTLRIDDYKGLDMEITIPDEITGKTVTELGDGVFDPAKGSSLQSDVKNHIVKVILPSTIQRIGKHVFRDCFSLKIVELSDNIVEIDEGAFERCKTLEVINMPTKLKVIGRTAFSATHSVKKCIFPEGLKTICKGAFLYGGLKEVHIPESVTSIEEGAFGFANRDLVIYGKGGSEAERFANESGIKFVAE